MAPLALLAALATAVPLELEAAVDRALARSPELSAAVSSETAAEARRRKAASTWWPRLEVSASYLARTPVADLPIELPALPGIPPVPPIDDLHHFQGGLRLGYRLFDFSRGALIDAAEHEATAEQARTRETRSELAFRVRATYLSALFAKEVRKLSEESLSVSEREVARAEAQAAGGTGTAVAVAQAKVRRAALAAQAARAASEERRWLGQLSKLVGEELEIGGDLAVWAARETRLPDLDDAPAMERFGALEAAAESAASSHRRGWLPVVSLTAAALLQYPNAFELELGPSFEAGASLTWSFFDGGQRSASIDEAQAHAERARAGATAAREALDRREIDLTARRTTAEAELASARDRLEQNATYLRVARSAVEAGTGTELDVHQAQLGVDQAEIALREAQLALALIRAEKLLVHGVAAEGELR